MTLAARMRMRPAVYPAAIAIAFVLNLMIEAEVSPYAAGRPLIAAFLIGLALPWLAGLATGDRHVAGLLGVVAVLVLLASPSLLVPFLGISALALIAAQRTLAQRRAESQAARERMWSLVTRVLTAGALILLVAVGIKAVQLGRVEAIAHDLVAEFPHLGRAVVAAAPTADLPNIYLVLLDGYPRADKLLSEFGVDVSGFTRALGDRGFVVAAHSRSNHTTTRVTLTQMFDYGASIGSSGPDGDRHDLWRHRINQGSFFRDIRGLGYEVIAISPGYEHVALRQADRFIDSGQLNEFELAVMNMTGAHVVIEAAVPSLVADLHRARVVDAFRATEDVALERTMAPRFVLTHVASPHSPLVFEADGGPIDVRGTELQFDAEEVASLGWAEYVRRLDSQLRFIDTRTVALVDRIIASDPRAVIVVFSDHGSGARWGLPSPAQPDADLRTANLLAVRAPGRTGIIDDRSTLANVLPRLLRTYAGIGPADVPETIYVFAEQPDMATVFMRPD